MRHIILAARPLTLLTFLICLAGAIPRAVIAQNGPDVDHSQSQRPRRVNPPDVKLPPGDPVDVVKVNTDLVRVDVSVTDKAGRPIRSLSQDDFKLFEDGMERPISFFNIEQSGGQKRPIAVVFALDISGSMSVEELARLRSAMQVFADRLSDRNSVFAVITFGMTVKTLQSFTSDKEKLERSFDRLAHEPNGLSTHAFDAVDDAVRMLVRHAPRTRNSQPIRRAVVVVTDGFPVGDTVSPQTVIERANAVDVSVYTVTLPSYSRLLASSNPTPLPTPLDVTGLAERTGGSNVYATDKNFDPLFRSIAEAVASTYVVAFYPNEENRHDGRFHEIRIQGPEGLTLKQSRPGYKSNEK
jgi:VWFA-related protein